MHPEIVSEIRKNARRHLIGWLQHIENPFSKAAEAGYISFDDMYFLGAFYGAGNISSQSLVETEEVPTIESVGVSFVVTDDPNFRSRESDLTFKLVAQMYEVTPAEAEKRYSNIMSNLTRYVGDSIFG